MLRLIGAFVIVVLIVGPLLAQAGLLNDAGLSRELVELEVRAFAALATWARGMVHTQP